MDEGGDEKAGHQKKEHLCDESVLATLHQYQQTGHLCDATVISSDGRQIVAHAAVLAAANSMLAQELSECERGSYTISLPLNDIETEAFILFAYTGEKNVSKLDDLSQLHVFCEECETLSHDRRIIGNLDDFAEKGLFCNMACCNASGEIQPTYSFLMAAKCDFISQHIKTGSIVYVNISDDVTSFEKSLSDLASHDSNYLDKYTFDGGGELEQSLDKMTGNETYTCTMCNKSYRTKGVLMLHMCFHSREIINDYGIHHTIPESTYESEINNEGLIEEKMVISLHDEHNALGQHHTNAGPMSATLAQHCVNNVPIPFLYCDRPTSGDDEEYSQIKRPKKITTNNKTYTCVTCKESFKKKRELKQHQTVHSENLEIKQVTTDDRPYGCIKCAKSFRRKHELKQHQAVHTAEKPYTCDICQRGFSLLGNMLKHQSVHTGEKPFKCDLCQKSFRTKNELRQHDSVHTSDRPHVCDICKKGFTLVSNLMAHKRLHTDEKPFVCDNCQKSFSQKNSLRYHELYFCKTCGKCLQSKRKWEQHKCNLKSDDSLGIVVPNTTSDNGVIHERIYPCETCNKSFGTKSCLRRHQAVHDDQPYQFMCDICGKRLKSKYILTEHKLTHRDSKPHICSTCDRGFRRKHELKEHQYLHTGVKPFKCPTCEKFFGTKAILRMHEQTHITDRPFVCTVCDKAFKKNYELVGHARVHIADRPYICTTCNGTFKTKSNLKLHEQLHTNNKPYECPTCKKLFRRRGDMRLHEREHTGDKPHSCDMCVKRFSTLGRLRAHAITHTGEKLHKCGTCNKTFGQKYTLTEHERIHSGVKPYECDKCGKKFGVKQRLLKHCRRISCIYRKNNSRLTKLLSDNVKDVLS